MIWYDIHKDQDCSSIHEKAIKLTITKTFLEVIWKIV